MSVKPEVSKGICSAKVKQTFVLFLLLILSACQAWRSPEKPELGRVNQTSNLLERVLVKEAVLGELGISPKMSIREQETTTFLFVREEEQEYFSNRYSALAPVVKVRVEGDAAAKMVDGTVVDAETGKRAIIFSVSVARLEGPKAKAEGGFFYGNLGGMFYSYDLRLERGRWRIITKQFSLAF